VGWPVATSRLMPSRSSALLPGALQRLLSDARPRCRYAAVAAKICSVALACCSTRFVTSCMLRIRLDVQQEFDGGHLTLEHLLVTARELPQVECTNPNAKRSHRAGRSRHGDPSSQEKRTLQPILLSFSVTPHGLSLPYLLQHVGRDTPQRASPVRAPGVDNRAMEPQRGYSRQVSQGCRSAHARR